MPKNKEEIILVPKEWLEELQRISQSLINPQITTPDLHYIHGYISSVKYLLKHFKQ